MGLLCISTEILILYELKLVPISCKMVDSARKDGDSDFLVSLISPLTTFLIHGLMTKP